MKKRKEDEAKKNNEEKKGRHSAWVYHWSNRKLNRKEYMYQWSRKEKNKRFKKKWRKEKHRCVWIYYW